MIRINHVRGEIFLIYDTSNYQYLHSDGVWRTTTVHNGLFTGWYHTRGSAEKFLEQFCSRKFRDLNIGDKFKWKGVDSQIVDIHCLPLKQSAIGYIEISNPTEICWIHPDLWNDKVQLCQ